MSHGTKGDERKRDRDIDLGTYHHTEKWNSDGKSSQLERVPGSRITAEHVVSKGDS